MPLSRRIPCSAMSSLSLLFVWTTLLLSIANRSKVYGVVLTTTEPNASVTVSGEGDGLPEGIKDFYDLGHEEESDNEDNEEHISINSFFIDDDSIRVQPVIKPENADASTATVSKKGEKKNGEKKKKKGSKKGNKKKKQNPCLTTHKKFCIHGECRYLEKVPEVSCKCQQNFFGERCSEQSMTSAKEKLSDITTTTVLAVIAVLLSTLSISAIIIIIVVHTRRKYPSYQYEAEEKKKLGQENGSDEV
ncbi:PREDICTED: amphiregulin [Nanorana parkeri]|uniref:amphiregulin n=1 Tax=Nanorana parkeri TaxID=125878 RepID=UPI0008541C71|nr:PREDICTED: amphiregulin [Nanorana parkeri]